METDQVYKLLVVHFHTLRFLILMTDLNKLYDTFNIFPTSFWKISNPQMLK